MQRRTLFCPLQMVQYLSQVQRSSGKSHCMQTVGACIRPSGKTVPEPWSRGKAKVERVRRVVYLLRCVCRQLPFTAPSLTRLCVHASIDFCPSTWNGIHNNSSPERASQDAVEHNSPPPWRKDGEFRRLGHARGIPVERRADRGTQSSARERGRF